MGYRLHLCCQFILKAKHKSFIEYTVKTNFQFQLFYKYLSAFYGLDIISTTIPFLCSLYTSASGYNKYIKGLKSTVITQMLDQGLGMLILEQTLEISYLRERYPRKKDSVEQRKSGVFSQGPR